MGSAPFQRMVVIGDSIAYTADPLNRLILARWASRV